MAQIVKNLPAVLETRVQSLGHPVKGINIQRRNVLNTNEAGQEKARKKLKEQSNWPKSYPAKSSGKEMKNWGELGQPPIS